MSFEPETTTYRAGSLEELLPQIREELGSDAVIVRQREGIVGGVGGFFGKKCVEVEARPAAARPSVPPRSVINAYDTGDGPEPENGDLPQGNALLDTLMAQTSPFGDELAQALGLLPDEPAHPVPAPKPQPQVQVQPDIELEPLPVAVEEPVRPAVARPSLLADLASRPVEKPAYLDVPKPVAVAVAGDDAATARTAMESAGIPLSIVDAVISEVEDVLRPFEPFTSFRDLARRALARHIQVQHGWRSKRRTIALVGLPGSGKTLTTAKLAHAYARAGRSVTALSLEAPRRAAELGNLTEGAGVELEIADSPEKVTLARKGLHSDVVLVDTPSLLDPVDGRRLAPLLRMLEALKADETHLLVPASADGAEARAFMASLLRQTTPSRLIVTHADARAHTGVPVALSLTEKIPLSYVAEGDRAVGGVTLAEPDVLARMVLA